MNIEIKEIQIKFNPNFQDKEIDFNLDMLYNETTVDKKKVELKTEGLNKLPYFTLDIEYPNLSGILTTYQERVDFFFDKEQFRKILLKNGEIIQKTKNEIDGIKKKIENQKALRVAEHNVMTMIELLFPTKFTVINNFHTSYDHIFDNSSLKRMMITPFGEKKYSYLKMSGKPI